MKITRHDEPTEIEQFIARFPTGKNYKYSVYSTPDGKIKEVKTNDKEIIKFCKKFGLIE